MIGRIAGIQQAIASACAVAGATLVPSLTGEPDPVMLSALAASVAGAAATFSRRRLVAGVHELSDAAEDLAHGDTGVQLVPPACEELRPAAETIGRLAGRLAREHHARANFIGKVSHELRTPITVDKGLSRVHLETNGREHEIGRDLRPLER